MKFTFLKIPVIIHPSFWLFLLLFASSCNQIIIWGIILAISILFHEYGHGLTALYFGVNPTINLEAFGGNTEYFNTHLTEKQQFLITLNGPIFSGILILLSYYLLKSNLFQNSQIQYFLYVSMKLNIFWGIINILPLYPLDGGKLLRHILTTHFGDKGLKISSIIGNICAVLGCVYFLSQHYYFFGILFFIYGLRNLQTHRFTFTSHKKDSFQFYTEGIKAMEDNDNKKAKSIFKKLLKTKAANNLDISATESLATILYKENRKKEAYELLLKTDHTHLKKGKCLLCKLVYEAKNYDLIKKENLSHQNYYIIT